MGIANALRAKAARLLMPSTSQYRVITDRMPGVPIYPEMTVSRATRQGYKLSIYVYRAVRATVKACSAVPWVTLNSKGEEIPDHPFTQLMRRPNPEFSGQDIIEFLVAHKRLTGNALWKPVIVGGIPREIWPIMPDLVSPIPSDKPGEWLEAWQVTDRNGQRKLPPDEFIHFMEMDPGNMYWGTGPLMAAARTVDTDNEAQDTQKVSMQNRGTPSGIFSIAEPMTDEQFEEARRRMKEQYLDKTRRREPWILDGGAKWQTTGMTPIEMDYIASRLRNLRDIATAFEMDPWWLGDREHSSYNNVSEARRSLYEDTALPLLDDVAATLNLRMAPLYGGDITIAYDASNIRALKSDMKDRIDSAHTLWTMGVPMEQINGQLGLGLTEYQGWENGYLPLNLESTKAMPGGYEVKSIITEEQKAAAWKRVDRRRVAWWPVIAKRMEPLYKAEGEAITGLASITDASAESAIDSLSPKWLTTITGTLTALVEDFGQEEAEALGAAKSAGPTSHKWEFDPMEAALLEWVKKTAASEVKTILETNLDDVRRVIQKGIAENLTNDQVARNIRQFYTDNSPYKAMRVARTETTKGATHATMAAADQSGIVDRKQWITARDDRVRDEHAAMDGETVGLHENFSNGLEGPGEPNCRCSMIMVLKQARG